MCGIAGIIRRGNPGNIGKEMTSMLRSLKHRGPDSTGFAVYGSPGENQCVMRFKVAEQEDVSKGFDIHQQIKNRRALVNSRLIEMGVEILTEEEATEYAFRYTFNFDGDMRRVADYIEDIDNVEIMSLGEGLELIKDLGDADGCGCTYHAKHFGRILHVGGQDSQCNLNIVMQAFGEQRPDGSVGESGSQDTILSGSALPAEEAPGNFANGIHPLFVVDRQREEVNVLGPGPR